MIIKNLKIYRFLILFIMAGLAGTTYADNVEFTAAVKNTVQVGEQFRLVYTVNAQGRDFQGPSLEGFRILSGPNPSTNQSYQIINGQVAQSFTMTYTYYLQATKEGSYIIPPATIDVNGKKYSSNTQKITVLKGNAPTTQSNQGNQGNQRSGNTSETGISSEDVFIKASIDNSNPYQGDQVIITYRIYTTIPISQINITKLSSFPGFWYNSLLSDSDQLKQHNETINGKQYVVADIRKIALYPQRSGEIKIEPMELNCTAQIKSQSNARSRDPFFDSFFNDPFFNRAFKNVDLNLKSNSVSLNVKPLPTLKRPANFSGAVGSYSISSSIDRTEVKANEPIVLKYTVNGKGNIELIDDLNITFPPDFESYDPKITNNISKSSSGISGSRTFEYLVIPRNAGTFEIKPVDFNYFDPEKNTYITLTTPAYKIKVAKGDTESNGISYSGVSQKDVQFIGSDIHHIKTHEFPLTMINTFFFGSNLFFILLIAPVLLFILLIIIWKQNISRRSNLELMNKRKANRVASKNLKKAATYLKIDDSDNFYIEISRALWGYISNKISIAQSELSIETVKQRLSDRKISQQTSDEFIKVLDDTEYARFAPGNKTQRMQEIYTAAMNIITQIERELK